MALRKAKRQSVKLRIGLSGPSGSGKTYSALLLAKGLMGGSLDDVAIISTDSKNDEIDLNEITASQLRSMSVEEEDDWYRKN